MAEFGAIGIPRRLFWFQSDHVRYSVVFAIGPTSTIEFP